MDLYAVLSVSKASFYKHLRGKTYVSSPLKEKEGSLVQEVFLEPKGRYGTRRIVADLANRGIKIGRFKARSLMKKQNLKAIQLKSFVPKTTDSNHSFDRNTNLLLDRESATKPYEVLLGDIT